MLLIPQTDRFTTEPPEPGVYADIPAPVYFSWRAASKSLLKQVLDCPTDRHLIRVLQEPQTMTAALADGAAYDAMMLEPERFAAEYVAVPKMTRKGAEWDRVLARAGGDPSRVIWESDDVDNPTRLDMATLTAMRLALRREARQRTCLSCPGAKVQLSIVWDDAATGLRCKMRIDRLLPGHVIVDLKTARTAERVEFGKACIEHGYDIQADMYCTGYRSAFGVDPTFLFLVQEKHGDFESAIYDATDERELPTLAQVGRVRTARAMARLADAITKNEWSGYSAEPMPVCVPVWAAAWLTDRFASERA